MIESVDNIIQLVMAVTATVIAMYRAVSLKSRAWSMLGLFSGVFSLGLTYWLLFLVFYGHVPQYSYIPDICWYSSYLFLMLLNIYVRDESSGKDAFDARPGESLFSVIRRMNPLLWCIPLFTYGMCLFFMQYGDYIGNIVAATVMTGLIWHAASGLLSLKGQDDKNKSLYMVTLLFCFAEYALWVTSCFWSENSITSPYLWFDLLLSATFLMFVRALGKAACR